MVSRVGVVGAGTMGRGIAQVFAQAGFSVVLQDIYQPALDAAREAIGRSVAKLLEKGLVSTEQAERGRTGISYDADGAALEGVELVVEAASERLDLKRQVFEHLDKHLAATAILATNTSSIPISTLASATGRPGLVIGMHFMNPVPLMPLVEVIRGHATAHETVVATLAVCERLGKTAVEVADSPGFIANRILLPMINEAAFALMEGVGTVDAIDTVMRLGMNHPMGPLALADLIGLDVCVAILEVMEEGLGNAKYRPCPLLRRMVEAGELGRKAGRGFYRY